MKKLLLTLGLLGVMTLDAAERYVPEYLNAISCTVRAEAGYQRAEGSGTLFVRDMNGTATWFALTAGHVVEHLRKIEETIVDGKPSKTVTFENPKLVRELRNRDGRRTGEVVVDAKVLRYSPADKHDLCLMIVLSEDFKAAASAEFYPKDGKLPRIGSHLNHCGSFLGGDGANSYSDGVISSHGRILFKMPFMQTTAPAYPGSSGGIVADDKGRYIGMLVRGAGSDYNLCVPIARMHNWAQKSGIAWALSSSLKAPSMAELEKLPVEGPAESGGSGSGTHKDYPFQIRRMDLREAKGGEK
jgi:S1-C subfamily serine protease